MTLADILKRELAETKHYEMYAAAMPAALFGSTPSVFTISCKCNYHLAQVNHDHVAYRNRRGDATLYAADPHFFDKLKKLLTELHRRHQNSHNAFGPKYNKT